MRPSALIVMILAAAMAACTPAALNKDRNAVAPVPDRAAASATLLSEYLELLQKIVQSPPAEQAEIFWTIDDRVFSNGEENENEEEHTDLNGNVRTIVTHKRLVHVGDGIPLLVGVITDITEFREAESHSRYLRCMTG